MTLGVRRMLETALDCDDLARAAAFYRTLLNVEPMVSAERLVAFDVGEGTVLLLFQRGIASQPVETAAGLVPAHDARGTSHLAFAIDASDMTAWEARLAELGIAIESRVRWPRGGVSLYFRDPDGHSVELVTPGLWPSY